MGGRELNTNEFKIGVEEFLNVTNEFPQIYIYGYSNISRNAFFLLKNVFGNKIKGILVTHMKLAYKSNSITVLEVKDVDLFDSAVIVATNSIFFEEIQRELKDKCKIVLFYDEQIDKQLIKMSKGIPLVETRLLSICVGQACNYKCRDCANFAPYAKKENLRYQVKDIINDIDNLLPMFSRIDKIHVQGGEPFLYSDLSILLEHLKEKYGQIHGKIQIATNGEIIPNEKVLSLMEKGGYEVRISAYNNIDKKSMLIKELEDRRIPYRVYKFAGKNGKWSDSGNRFYIEPDGEDTMSKVLNCRWCTCYTVENHMIGRCARSIPALTVQGIERREEDYISIDQDLTIDRLRNYFMFIKPMEACRHCKGSGGEEIEAAIQI